MLRSARRSTLARTFSGIAILLLLAQVTTAAGAEQPTEPPKNPRVALVLSGGGARGFAHVGVLQVLEELHIPVDLVIGTSMGALIGGLYASGLSPEALEEVVTGIDWTTAFDDIPPRRERSFRRKQDDFDFLTSLRLYMKDFKLALPKGFIAGQKISNILGGLTVPVGTVRDFDALPIPFRAIATDARTGKPVILGDGELARALRASMAIPGIFSPVEKDGHTLVDGGIAMNLPVAVARAMGAQTIIAVDISTRPSDDAEVGSAFTITGQMLSVLMYENTIEQIESLTDQDLLIQPDLTGITSSSFEKGELTIARGVDATRAASPNLTHLSVSPEVFAVYRERADTAQMEPAVVDRIRFDNDSRLSTKIIERHVNVELGQPLDVEGLQHDLDTLYGDGVFERVVFSLNDVDGQRELVIRTDAKETGRTFLRFGLNLDTNFRAESAFNLAILSTMMPVNRLGAEWRNRFQIGDTSEFESEFYQPLDYGRRYFFAPELRIGIENLDIFVNDERVATYDQSEFRALGSFGRIFSNWGELRVGMGYLKTEFERRIGDPDLPTFRFEGGSLTGSATIDTMDSVRFPRRGTLFRVRSDLIVDALGANDTLAVVEARGSHSFSFGENTITPTLRFGTSWAEERDISLAPVFSLGGFLNLSGLDADQRLGPHIAFGSLIGYRRVANPRFFTLNLPVYVGGSIELGNAFRRLEDIQFSDLTLAGSVFVGIDTPLGPLYVAYGAAEGGHRSGYLFLGQVF